MTRVFLAPQSGFAPILAVMRGGSARISMYLHEGDDFTSLPNPIVGGIGITYDGTPKLAFSGDGVYMAAVTTVTPYIRIYKRSGNSFSELSSPAALPTGVGRSIALTNDGTYLVVGHETTPFITIYKRNGDEFTKLANPSILPRTAVNGLSFSADGSKLAVSFPAPDVPKMYIYDRSGDTFTKTAQSSSVIAGDGTAISADGNYVVNAASYSAGTTAVWYKLTGSALTLIGSTTVPGALSVAFSPDAIYTAVGRGTSSVALFKRTGDSISQIGVLSPNPSGAALGVSFDSSGDYLAVAHSDTPYLSIYKRSGDTFTKLSTPSVLPDNAAYSVAFWPRPY